VQLFVQEWMKEIEWHLDGLEGSGMLRETVAN
jgi:hypothetical protein